MKFELYAVKDLKTAFLPITHDQNDECAKRNFTLACRANKDSTFFQFPSDYQLWHIGSFDSETGDLESDVRFIMDAPLNLGDDE